MKAEKKKKKEIKKISKIKKRYISIYRILQSNDRIIAEEREKEFKEILKNQQKKSRRKNKCK